MGGKKGSCVAACATVAACLACSTWPLRIVLQAREPTSTQRAAESEKNQMLEAKSFPSGKVSTVGSLSETKARVSPRDVILLRKAEATAAIQADAVDGWIASAPPGCKRESKEGRSRSWG